MTEEARYPSIEDTTRDPAQILFENRQVNDLRFIDSFREAGIYKDVLQVFLCDGDRQFSLCENEKIREYLQKGPSKNHPLERAWLDDREMPSGASRKYPLRLSAKQLHEYLSRARFSCAGQPNADRRLIYIPNLDSDFIHALLNTVSYHQQKALKDAVYRYLDSQAFLSVQIPVLRSAVFRLNLHLPYLALRSLTPGSLQEENTLVQDLSFLRPECRYSIQGHQISVVICGSGQSQWVGYAFIKNDAEEGNQSDGEDEDEFQEDPITSDNINAGGFLAPDKPICDPRGYWLLVFEIRLGIVLDEWKNLMNCLEKNIKTWAKTHLFSRSGRAPGGNNPVDVLESYNWIVKSSELLYTVHEPLSKTLDAWARFSGPDGSLRNLLISAVEHDHKVLESIRDIFDQLRDVEARLISLERTCEACDKILTLYMNLESRSLNIDSNKTSNLSHKVNLRTSRVALQNQRIAQHTSEATYKGLLINHLLMPVSVVLAYFGTPDGIFEFERNKISFIASIMLLIGGLQIMLYTISRLSESEWLKQILEWVWSGQRNDDDDIEMNELE